MRRHYLGLITLVSCFLGSTGARAHHSYSEYDEKQTIEIEGTIVGVALQNPHVHFSVQTTGDADVVTWDIEITSLNWLHRIKMPLDTVDVGNKVRFSGWPSKRSPDRMYGLNMLAADGREFLLFRTATPKWSTTALGFGAQEAQSFFQGGVASRSDTLFRVWASDLDDSGRLLSLAAPLSLTEAAKKAVAAFDPINDSTSSGCTPKGMPIVVSHPPPIEIVDRGSTIQIRMEEYETVRTIHLGASANPDEQPRTPLGYSVGHWEGKTLVVETSRVDFPYLNTSGVPQSASARFVERFTPAADGSRLAYALTIIDPDSLTVPAELKRFWVSRPGEEVLPFKCVER